MKVLVDTSVFIDFSRTGEGDLIDLNILAKKNQIKLYTSSIVIAEYWAGDDMQYKKNTKRAEDIFLNLKNIDCDSRIAKIAGELIQKKYIKGFDALIAATALSVNAQVATKNIKHFKKVPKLKIFSIPKN